jgi:hypothetical protein
LPREEIIILRLQGFNAVSIIGLNPDLAKVGDLALLVTHTIMYTRVQIWPKARDGLGSRTTITHINTHVIFHQFLSNPLNIEIFEEIKSIPKV